MNYKIDKVKQYSNQENMRKQRQIAQIAAADCWAILTATSEKASNSFFAASFFDRWIDEKSY